MFTGAAQRGAMRSSPTSRPAASDSRRAQRAASADVVRDEQERRAALAIEPEHEVDDFHAGGVVEVAGRLVGHQQLGLAGEGARDGDPLLFAARELLRVVRRALRESDAREPVPRLRRGIRRAGELQREHHVLERGQRREQLERLEDETEQALPHRGARVLVEAGQRVAVEPDVAARSGGRAPRAGRAAWSCPNRTRRRPRRRRPRRPRTRHRRGSSAAPRRSSRSWSDRRREEGVGPWNDGHWGRPAPVASAAPYVRWHRREGTAVAQRQVQRRILPCRSRRTARDSTITARLRHGLALPRRLPAAVSCWLPRRVGARVRRGAARARRSRRAGRCWSSATRSPRPTGSRRAPAGSTCCAARLTAQRYPYRVVNASITGDTTAGGRARLPALLATLQAGHRRPRTGRQRRAARRRPAARRARTSTRWSPPSRARARRC